MLAKKLYPNWKESENEDDGPDTYQPIINYYGDVLIQKIDKGRSPDIRIFYKIKNKKTT